MPWTLVGVVTGSPDYGLWRTFSNQYLYVHRGIIFIFIFLFFDFFKNNLKFSKIGQGFRSLASNFLVRMGVRNENSVLCWQLNEN